MKHTLVRLDDGAHTHVTQWGERGPAIVCVHGMTSSRLGWARFAQRYLGRYRVIAYDQRGHGESAHVVGPMSLERSIRDLENVVHTLRVESPILVGHSWGGAVVIRGASPVAARAIVAIDPVIRQVAPAWYDEYLEELEVMFSLEGDARDKYVRAEYDGAHPLDREGKVHAVHGMRGETLLALRDENPPESWDLREEIARMDRPVLLALADPAESIVAHDDFRFIEATRNDAVRVEVFEGEGHSLHRTAFERFGATFDRFVAELATRSSG